MRQGAEATDADARGGGRRARPLQVLRACTSLVRVPSAAASDDPDAALLPPAAEAQLIAAEDARRQALSPPYKEFGNFGD